MQFGPLSVYLRSGKSRVMGLFHEMVVRRDKALDAADV